MKSSWKPLSLLLITLLLGACGENKPAAPAAAPAAAPETARPAEAAKPAEATAAPAGDAAAGGEAVFKKVCSMCHQTGAAGAPMVGNKTDWQPRIAQGKDTLYKHALEGFNGKTGAMPAKGGSPTLTDAEVKSAVDFMVGKVQ